MAGEKHRRKYIRFLGLDWEPRELAVFILGIVLFVAGLLLMWLFSRPELELSNMLLAILGILVSLGQYVVTATKGFINSTVAPRLDEIGNMLNKHTELLTEIASTLREVRDILRKSS